MNEFDFLGSWIELAFQILSVPSLCGDYNNNYVKLCKLYGNKQGTYFLLNLLINYQFLF